MTKQKHAFGLMAPAKLNLFLHVIGRRPDGKHLLQSVFILLDLHDIIDITTLNENTIQRTGDIVGSPEKDLCIRAARLLKEKFNILTGVSIRVKKRIPAGAGMGGGSSDAATVLIALNRLFNLDLSRSELMKIGEELGADVPFFIWGRTGFVEGIGEQIQPVTVPESTYAIVWPGIGISTAEIFNDPNLTRDSESMKISHFSEAVSDCWPELFGRNDLQAVAQTLEPRVSTALGMLSNCCSPRMTGSGSAVFGILRDESSVSSFLKNLPNKWIGFTSKSLEKHPLFDWLES